MKRGFTLVELLVVMFIVVILAGIITAPFIHFSQMGNGEHSGFITAIDQRGYIFRNYDVYFKTDNSSSQEDIYCINRNNPDLIKRAQEVNKTREQVTITYHGVRGIGLGLCGWGEIDSINTK